MLQVDVPGYPTTDANVADPVACRPTTRAASASSISRSSTTDVKPCSASGSRRSHFAAILSRPGELRRASEMAGSKSSMGLRSSSRICLPPSVFCRARPAYSSSRFSPSTNAQSTPEQLLVSQCDHRIHFRGSSRRNIASDRSDPSQGK